MLVGASDPPEPAGKDAVRTLNKFLKFARRLPFDYFSEIRFTEISEESMCPRTAAVPTASVLFYVRPTVHNRPFAARRTASANAAPTTIAKIKPIPSTPMVRDSRRKWREAHPDYQQKYREPSGGSRAEPPAAAAAGPQAPPPHLVKNNLALDLKHSAAEVWLVGPGRRS